MAVELGGGPHALIGHTGFVGGHLVTPETTHFFNSKNIEEIRGQSFQSVICAGAAGLKWQANKDPDADKEGIRRLTDPLAFVKAHLFVLISTISVYDVTEGDVDENRDVWAVSSYKGTSDDIFSRGYTPYGVHRAELEDWVRKNTGLGKALRHSLIVRLPGIYGKNISKNYIFDLMTGSPYMHKIDLSTCHQWYALRLLRGDIDQISEKILKERTEVTVLNLFPEPITTLDIVRKIFPDLESQCKPIAKDEYPNGPYSFLDDVKTIHFESFQEDGGERGYRYDKKRSLKELENFVQEHKLISTCRLISGQGQPSKQCNL